MDYSILTTPRAILDSAPITPTPDDKDFDFVGRAGSSEIEVKTKRSHCDAAMLDSFAAMVRSNAKSNAIATAAYGVPVAIICITV